MTPMFERPICGRCVKRMVSVRPEIAEVELCDECSARLKRHPAFAERLRNLEAAEGDA